MNIQEKFKEIVAEVNRLKEVRKVNVKAIADRLGIERTSAYALLKGELTRKNGNRNFSDAVINKLYSQLIEKAAPIDITSFQFLSGLSDGCQSNGLMAVVTGKAGVGKSTTLKHVCNSRENAYYILCNHLDSTEDFIGKIHSALGLKEVIARGKKKRKSMIEAIIDFTYRQESIPLLILDDIHHLGTAVYQDLKVLFDGTENMLGILLVGTPVLEENLKKWAGYDIDWKARYKPRAIMPELVRRFKDNFYQVPQLQQSDLKKILDAYKIADAMIARHFIKLPHFELGMFTDKLENACRIREQDPSLEIGLELILSL